MITIALTSSGIPVAVSRLVAQQQAKKNDYLIRKTIKISLLMVGITSTFISIIIFMNIQNIAGNILKDTRTIQSLFIFSPCIIIIALGAVLKGYFYGCKDIRPSALAEIIEQVARMTFVIILLIYLPPLKIEISAAIVVLGMVIGELASLLYLHYRYYHSDKLLQNVKSAIPSSGLIKSIITIAVPVTFTRLLSSIMTATNSILIPQRLVASGMSGNEAIATFGIVTGMVLPLLFLPFTLISALSVIIIPNLSENIELNNWKAIRDKTSKSILITCLSAFPSMAILISIGRTLGTVIYNQADVGKYLIPLSFSVIFLCLQNCMGNILNGLGYQNKSALHFLIGGFIQIVCTYTLIAQPKIGVYGFIIGFFLNTIIVSSFNFITVIKKTSLKIDLKEWFLKPGIASLVMGLIIRFVYIILTDLKVSSIISIIFSISSGLLILIISLLLLKIIPYRMLKKYII
jgi:stage V sporulation protein B